MTRAIKATLDIELCEKWHSFSKKSSQRQEKNKRNFWVTKQKRRKLHSCVHSMPCQSTIDQTITKETTKNYNNNNNNSIINFNNLRILNNKQNLNIDLLIHSFVHSCVKNQLMLNINNKKKYAFSFFFCFFFLFSVLFSFSHSFLSN